MPFVIRDAEISDMDYLQGVFERACLSNEHDRELMREHPEWLVLSGEAVVEKRMRVAVGDDGTITGFATYLIADELAELEDLFVDPPWMRQGIATALVLDISARLDDLHFEKLEVTANPHAMMFYQNLGFVTDRIVDTPGYPAPRMSRPTRSGAPRLSPPSGDSAQRLNRLRPGIGHVYQSDGSGHAPGSASRSA